MAKNQVVRSHLLRCRSLSRHPVLVAVVTLVVLELVYSYRQSCPLAVLEEQQVLLLQDSRSCFLALSQRQARAVCFEKERLADPWSPFAAVLFAAL